MKWFHCTHFIVKVDFWLFDLSACAYTSHYVYSVSSVGYPELTPCKNQLTAVNVHSWPQFLNRSLHVVLNFFANGQQCIYWFESWSVTLCIKFYWCICIYAQSCISCSSQISNALLPICKHMFICSIKNFQISSALLPIYKHHHVYLLKKKTFQFWL